MCNGSLNIGRLATSGAGRASGGPAITLSVVDQNGKPVTTLTAGQSATAVAVVTLNGVKQSGVLVTFTPTGSLVNVSSPLSGTVVTDATGTAQATIVPSGTGGGGTTLSAAADVNATTVTASASFNVGQATSTGLLISSFVAANQTNAVTIGSYATTTLTAVVQTTSGGVPPSAATVNFTISGGTCNSGNSSVTANAVTSLTGGQQVANAVFSDNGCATGGSTGTATVSAALSSSTPPLPQVTVSVTAPTTGSLQFLTSSPSGTSITLKGQGGAGRQTFATMTFQLNDVSGHPVPNFPVCFDATTYAGGLTLDGWNNVLPPAGVTIDPTTGFVTNPAPQCGPNNTLGYVKNTGTNGQVVVQVNSGTQPTPVTIRARTAYPTVNSTPLLETLSNVLIISTGLPIDKNMDMAVDTANIDGRDFNGSVAKLTVSLADIFGNPVIDGTQVNFVTSGGAICTSTLGGCTTLNGSCSCDLVSQDKRPTDGRVVVMAYVIGLPNFVDKNATFIFSAPDTFDNLGNAYLDSDKSGAFNANSGVGFGAGNLASPANPQFDDIDQCFPYVFGTSCISAANGVSGTINTFPKSALTPSGAPAQLTTGYGPVYLRRQGVVYFSGGSGDLPTLVIPTSVTGPIPANATPQIVLPGVPGTTCPSPAPSVSFNAALMDGYGNPMASGTSLVTLVPSPTVAGSIIAGSPVAALGLREPDPVIDNNPLTLNSAGNNNVAKTSIYVTNNPATNARDPTLQFTAVTIGLSGAGSCTSGSSSSIQVLATSPKGPKATVCILYEGYPPDAGKQGNASYCRPQIDVHYQ